MSNDCSNNSRLELSEPADTVPACSVDAFDNRSDVGSDFSSSVASVDDSSSVSNVTGTAGLDSSRLQSIELAEPELVGILTAAVGDRTACSIATSVAEISDVSTSNAADSGSSVGVGESETTNTTDDCIIVS